MLKVKRKEERNMEDLENEIKKEVKISKKREVLSFFVWKKLNSYNFFNVIILQFIHSKRYKVNRFRINEEDHEASDSATYYVRPFIPFWSLQSLQFEDVNSYNEVPSQKNTKYPRYLMEKLVKTWLKKDTKWFDQQEVFEILKDDIVAMLDSKFPSPRELRKFIFIKL